MIHDVLTQLLSAPSSGRGVVYTALVETRGSTPQKPGAAMLVYEDGSQVGTLGGGCVEAEVKRAALEQLSSGESRIVSFTLDHDYGWDDGLICGGRMTMLIDPLSENRREFYETYHRLVSGGEGGTEAVVIGGAVDAPARFLFAADGTLVASLGDDIGTASTERMHSALSNLRPLSERPRPYVTQGVAYLPHLPRVRLLIIGAGHVGQRLAEYASEVDFDVWMADDRETYCNAERIPWASKHVVGPFETMLPELPVDEQTFCVIVTRGHNHDEEALFHLIQRSPRYLGMIGSQRKIRMIFDDLREQGISEESLARVHAPLGYDIGSQTVPEIAISIVAELIACRNLPSSASPRPRSS